MPSVLITGASRGIGRATALWLAGRGWEVLAGVRRAQDGDALTAAAPRSEDRCAAARHHRRRAGGRP
ncbi:MAG TPA: SDR family NAD(P)-dependent oxidoreductase [Solirubrobacteraceae bacterium]